MVVHWSSIEPNFMKIKVGVFENRASQITAFLVSGLHSNAYMPETGPCRKTGVEPVERAYPDACTDTNHEYQLQKLREIRSNKNEEISQFVRCLRIFKKKLTCLLLPKLPGLETWR